MLQAILYKINSAALLKYVKGCQKIVFVLDFK